eukprot:10217465-Alexandrium_andersonii.AAC.1
MCRSSSDSALTCTASSLSKTFRRSSAVLRQRPLRAAPRPTCSSAAATVTSAAPYAAVAISRPCAPRKKRIRK